MGRARGDAALSRRSPGACGAVASGLLVLLLAGCATQATVPPTPASRTGSDVTGQLYAGPSAVVHAAEAPVKSAAEGIERGDAAWREGNLDLAIYLYIQSLAFDASQAGPFLKIGAIHERLGNRLLAQKAYELALERDPDIAAVCERLGLLYLQSGRTDEARTLLTHAVELDANRWEAEDGLGIAADRRGDYALALQHYDRALEIAPGTASVLNNRGYSRFLAGDPAGAERDLRQATSLGAGAEAWMNLGKVQATAGRYADALQSLLQGMDRANAYNLLGEAAMHRGELLLARRYFELASAESPRYFAAAQANLAVVNERLAAQSQAAAAPPVH